MLFELLLILSILAPTASAHLVSVQHFTYHRGIWKGESTENTIQAPKYAQVDVTLFIVPENDDYQYCHWGSKQSRWCTDEIEERSYRTNFRLNPGESMTFSLKCRNNQWIAHRARCNWNIKETKETTCLHGGSAPNDCKCGPGTYAIEKKCIKCPAGSYQNKTAHEEQACLSCPAGFVCEEGTQNPKPCSTGFFCEERQDPDNIKPCPKGWICESGSAPRLCREGFICPWGQSEVPCNYGDFCPEGSWTWPGVWDDSTFGNTIGEKVKYANQGWENFSPLVSLNAECPDGILGGAKLQAEWDEKILRYDLLCVKGFGDAGYSTNVQRQQYAIHDDDGSIKVLSRAECTKIDRLKNCNKHKSAVMTPLSLYVFKSPFLQARLSQLPIECPILHALKGFEYRELTKNGDSFATVEYECCELPLKDDLIDEISRATASVTRCGVTHGSLQPAEIEEQNAQFQVERIEDRIDVLRARLTVVVNHITRIFELEPADTKELRRAQSQFAYANSVKDLSRLAREIETLFQYSPDGYCPSPPVFRWKPVCISPRCDYQLQQGMEKSWEERSFTELATGAEISRGVNHGKQVTNAIEETNESSETTRDGFSVGASVTAGVKLGVFSGSATVETGYTREWENSHTRGVTIKNEESQSVELSAGISQSSSRRISTELVKTSRISMTTSCSTDCKPKDDNQVVIWQWVAEQTDPKGRLATVYHCIYVCRSVTTPGIPLCPGGRCMNLDCTLCLPGTYADPEMDRFYSTTQHPTQYPTQSPTPYPTQRPTQFPTQFPTQRPTQYPTQDPTQYPTQRPTQFPSQDPTQLPTKFPTSSPSQAPSNFPTGHPSLSPISSPSSLPTGIPTSSPLVSPTTSQSQKNSGETSDSSSKQPNGSTATEAGAFSDTSTIVSAVLALILILVLFIACCYFGPRFRQRDKGHRDSSSSQPVYHDFNSLREIQHV